MISVGLHRGPGQRWRIGFVQTRLGVHSLGRYYLPEGWICTRLRQVRRPWMRSGVVGNQVEMLALRRGDAERLLHKAVCLVSVSLRLSFQILITVPAAIWCPAIAPTRVAETASPLSFHFSVGQKAP